MIGEMSVVPRVAKPFGSSLLESYWPEAEHLSNGLGSAVSFKIPMFGYVADLNELFTLARGWVIAISEKERTYFVSKTAYVATIKANYGLSWDVGTARTFAF